MLPLFCGTVRCDPGTVFQAVSGMAERAAVASLVASVRNRPEQLVLMLDRAQRQQTEQWRPLPYKPASAEVPSQLYGDINAVSSAIGPRSRE